MTNREHRRRLAHILATPDAPCAVGAHCPEHPTVALVCPCCEQARRGRVTSAAKVAAARANGRKGGRRKLVPAVVVALMLALGAHAADAHTTVWRVWCANTPRAGVTDSLAACKKSTATINQAIRACQTEGGRIVVEAMLKQPGACDRFPAPADCQCRFEYAD